MSPDASQFSSAVMLNPPLSILSDDLLGYIVEHLAKLSSISFKDLKSLSLADWAFTHHCQKQIFRTLTLDGSNIRISNKLEKMENILRDKPSFANSVRVMRLGLTRRNNRNEWLFNDPIFISTIQLLAESPRPPHQLHFGGHSFSSVIIEDHILLVDRLAQSFFPQTLTTLTLTECKNFPLSFFLICPRLREVRLDHVEATKEGHLHCPDELCSGSEPPALELFDYRDARSLVRQMITPPPGFHTPAVLWSNLRVLTLSPHEKKEMACLQSILNAACNTLEELFLTNLRVASYYEHLPLAALVNLRDLSHLRVFSLYIILRCPAGKPPVLRDINTILGTITSKRVTNLFFDMTFHDEHLQESLDEDWVGLCDQVIRISDEKPLELDFQLGVDTVILQPHEPGGHLLLYAHIMEKTARLSKYPQICTHFWDPSYWQRGCGPFPPNQVRGRCR